MINRSQITGVVVHALVRAVGRSVGAIFCHRCPLMKNLCKSRNGDVKKKKREKSILGCWYQLAVRCECRWDTHLYQSAWRLPISTSSSSNRQQQKITSKKRTHILKEEEEEADEDNWKCSRVERRQHSILGVYALTHTQKTDLK